MIDASRRPAGRLFCLLVAVIVTGAMPWTAPRAAAQSGPATTTVTDTVYQADGTPATGTLLISWPAFATAGGTPIAAGTTTATIAANGVFSVALVPNAGASPAGVYYTVVYQLGPGEVRTEYWVVPTTSPANLAAVRTTPGAGGAAQPVSMQYVNAALAAKANDNAVVHLSGTETISGTKTFSTPPSVPTPTSAGNIANKSYVDSAVANVGAGNYVPIAGGAMTGPLTLSGNPVAPFQAAPKQYVDTAFAAKADLISGLVPPSELGTGTANSGTCLLGNGTWGTCGTGNGNVSTTPTGSQNIAQPAGTQFTVNNFNGVVYAPPFNWNTTLSTNLVAGSNTVSLASCPLGADTTGNKNYYVTINNGAETDLVTGGSCPAGASGTITFTAANAYTSPTVGAANAGIQEALNYAAGTAASGNARWHVVVPPALYKVYAPIIIHASKGLLEGDGADLDCFTNSWCMQSGSLTSSNTFNAITVRGFRFLANTNDSGCAITQTARTAGSPATNTVTFASGTGCGPFNVGDWIRVDFTDNPVYWGDHLVSAVTANSVSWLQGGAAIAAQSTPGTLAHTNDAVLDNATPTKWEDLKYGQVGTSACVNTSYSNTCTFNAFFDFFDDENATVENFDSDGFGLDCGANYCGSFIYSGGSPGPGFGNGGVTAALIYVDHANITAGCSNGVTVYNSNGLHITNSVIQAVALWNVSVSNLAGNYQGAQLDYVYNESQGCPHTPWGYMGAAGVVYGPSTGASTLTSHGLGPGGKIPVSGSGSTTFNYWIVGHDTTTGAQTAPLLVAQALNNQSGAITINWPRLAAAPSPPLGQSPTDTITYDVIRTSGQLHAAPTSTGPMPGNCPGGSITACGSVVTALPQCAGLTCTYTDSGSAVTSSYAVSLSGSFQPTMTYWPGDVVLGGTVPSLVYMDSVPPTVNATQGILGGPVVYTTRCGGDEGTWVGCAADAGYAGNSLAVNPATLYGNVMGNPATQIQNPKGRLNFYNLNGNAYGGTGIITLWDSNPGKTLATAGHRPAMDSADTYLANDNAAQGFSNSQVQLAIGAPVSISEYVNSLPDNTHWLERLSASLKEFNVPTKFDTTVTFPFTGSGSQCLHVSATGVLSGAGSDCGTGAVSSGSASQLAMYSANGAAVSGDSALTDSGATLNYAGSGGITATSGTFGGNLTVNGQLLVAGPWTVSSPIPGTAMGPAAAGTSALGISNDGNFYISANSGTPQKVATTATSSYFSNLVQEDATDVGQFTVGETTANPQSLRVYSSYANSSSWQRTSVGFDPGSGFAVLRSESTGTAPGLGFMVGSGVKWVIDASSNLKPWADQSYNIGTFNGGTGTGLRPGTVYAAGSVASGSGFELGKFANESYELCNDTTTGTVVNGLAVLTTSACAAKPASALTSGAIGIVIANAGTSGTVTLARTGSVYCSFDATATVVGDYVAPSPTANGGFYYLCHDAGATRPTGTQILGRVLQASSGGTTVQMFLDMPGSSISNSLTAAGTGSCSPGQVVTSVNSGGPTCNTVTSAYVDSSIPSTSALVSGNYTKASGASAVADSGVAAGPYSTEWITAYRAGSAIAFNTTGTKIELWGVTLTFPLSTSTLSYNVSGADTSSNTYDLGIYSSSGMLVAHTGAIAGSTAMTLGAHSANWSGTNPKTLQPGKYYLAMTTSCTSSCATLSGDGSGAVVTFLSAGTVTTSGTQGTLDSSITVPSDSYTWGGTMISFIVK